MLIISMSGLEIHTRFRLSIGLTVLEVTQSLSTSPMYIKAFSLTQHLGYEPLGYQNLVPRCLLRPSIDPLEAMNLQHP